MVKTGKVVKKTGGGFGGGEQDTSSELKDMRMYELAILNRRVFEVLSKLKVFDTKTVEKDYEYVIIEKADIPGFTADSMGSAGHAINSIFAAAEIPYSATPYSSENAPTKEVLNDKNGKFKTVNLTDEIKIHRTGEEFDRTLYAIPGWGNTNKDGDELVYHRYSVGRKARTDRWLTEIAAVEFPEVLEDMGLTVEATEDEAEE